MTDVFLLIALLAFLLFLPILIRSGKLILLKGKLDRGCKKCGAEILYVGQADLIRKISSKNKFYIKGIAKNIVAYREKNGAFKSRDEFKNVPKELLPWIETFFFTRKVLRSAA